MALTDVITDIADAIRDKTGSVEPMYLDEMPDKIKSIDDIGQNVYTENTIMDTLISLEIAPVLLDAGGNVLADDSGIILTK